MIVKNHDSVPIFLQQLDVWRRRLPPHHSDQAYIESKFQRHLAGYRGEKSLIPHLVKLDPERYQILFNIRIPLKDNWFAQYDVLLLTPTFILVLEVKNISGISYYDSDFQQLVQFKDGEEIGMPDPIQQLNRQKHELRQSLNTDLPIEGLVVATNMKGIVRASENHPTAYQQVVRIENFLRKINHIEVQYSRENPKDVNMYIHWLISNHCEDQSNFDKMDRSLLRPGVFCHECQYLPLSRKKGRWFCPSCKAESKTAHLKALRDYYLIPNSTLTSREARDFLLVPSRHTIYRLMRQYFKEYSRKHYRIERILSITEPFLK